MEASEPIEPHRALDRARGVHHEDHAAALAEAVRCGEHARMLGDDVIGPELRSVDERHPSVGDVRGLGVFWAIELVRNRETREPLVPYNASGPAAAPMGEFAAACKVNGLWPFTHFNRVHIVPPCNTSVEDVRTGLAILDDALTAADAHCS